VRSKADMSQLNLPHGSNQTKKKWKREKLKSKNGYAQKYRQRVWGIRRVSPEEEKGYGGKNLQKRKALSLEACSWS